MLISRLQPNFYGSNNIYDHRQEHLVKAWVIHIFKLEFGEQWPKSTKDPELLLFFFLFFNFLLSLLLLFISHQPFSPDGQVLVGHCWMVSSPPRTQGKVLCQAGAQNIFMNFICPFWGDIKGIYKIGIELLFINRSPVLTASTLK